MSSKTGNTRIKKKSITEVFILLSFLIILGMRQLSKENNGGVLTLVGRK